MATPTPVEMKLTDLTPGMVKLAKDIMIDALAKNSREKGYLTRAQVRDAWKWIESLGGPGERLT